MNNENDAHVADCADPTVPQPNAYPYQLCCQIQEACNDGVDNDEDGLVDCVDPDCNEEPDISNTSHPAFGNADMSGDETPEICNFDPDSPYSNNAQSTADCVANPDDCTDPDGDRFYCAFGDYDAEGNETGESQVGRCCPPGKVPEEDPFTGEWSCGSSDECGVDAVSDCKFDITTNESAYFNSTYSGNPDDYCVSQVPNLYTSPDDQAVPPTRSQACCQVPKYGKMDYWFKDGNVKIYG
jgi:hypothetical protein